MTNYVQAALDRLNSELPNLDADLAQLYALLALTKGPATTLEDVHDAWALWRNATNPQHRSLIPFDELTVEVQELDRKYMVAIHAAAAGPGDDMFDRAGRLIPGAVAELDAESDRRMREQGGAR